MVRFQLEQGLIAVGFIADLHSTMVRFQLAQVKVLTVLHNYLHSTMVRFQSLRFVANCEL